MYPLYNIPLPFGAEESFLHDFEYQDYYSSLPEEVQESIDEHEDEFHSLDEMKAFAEEQMYLS